MPTSNAGVVFQLSERFASTSSATVILQSVFLQAGYQDTVVFVGKIVYDTTGNTFANLIHFRQCLQGSLL